jgi:hypothetical protein
MTATTDLERPRFARMYLKAAQGSRQSRAAGRTAADSSTDCPAPCSNSAPDTA